MIEEISKPARIILDQMNERRFIKTHLPFSLLPPNLLEIGCKVRGVLVRKHKTIYQLLFFIKVIYVARNPKDVAVSFYHLNRLIRTQGYIGDFPKYWDYFERNLRKCSFCVRARFLLVYFMHRTLDALLEPY